MTSVVKGNNCGLWGDCLSYISLRLKSSTYNTWFKHTRGELHENGKLVIVVPNQFVADWLSSHYDELIKESIKEVNGEFLNFSFKVMDKKEAAAQTEIEFRQRVPVASKPTNGESNLNERYSFDNFVVGEFNRLAHAAAVAVADGPGKTKYNPFLIYGGTGLGKTHLAQAIGHSIRDKAPGKRIIYATSEKFTSDFINSISNGTIAGFTTQYRTADVLLVDDIQFFSGKESTQEQFFHTFNDLHQSGKQIILTSDRHPNETKGLEERLLSRFSSGLVADLQPPDMEARTAILRKRTEQEHIAIAEDVLNLIANNVTSNIRELEGCLNRLMAYSSLENKPITLEFAMRILGKELARGRKDVSIADIQQRTAEFFKIDISMMSAKKKTSEIALARQVAMYLTRKYTRTSLKGIGDAFGGRDHSTVIHACCLVENRITTDIAFRDQINKLTTILIG